MVELEWYKYSESERITNVFSNYTIKDFWVWWQGDENKVMEVRIKDFLLIKEVSNLFEIPHSASGVYVNSAEELKAVIMYVRNKATVWFGVNSRRTNWNKYGRKTFGGLDANVLQIDYLPIDIDRVKKEGPAILVDLEACDKLANIILDRLATQGWNNSYCKICSGNGVQLLIKLDFPIKLPEIEFNNELKVYTTNREFEKTKELIRNGIGKDIVKFCKKYQTELGVEVDKSCFNIGRVFALPQTKNYKYNGFTWRGIIELKKGINEGLVDHIMNKSDDEEVYVKKNMFITKGLNTRDRIKQGALKDNILIRFMLDNDLPTGMRNNYLWFQVKCLLRDSKYDIKTDEYKQIHIQLEKKYGLLPSNVPDKKFVFDENIVNKYCIVNSIVPIYPLWPKRNKRNDRYINDVVWDDLYLAENETVLDTTNDIIEDLAELKKQLKDTPENKIVFLNFIKGCISKYGIKKTKYYFDNIMKRYICYD